MYFLGSPLSFKTFGKSPHLDNFVKQTYETYFSSQYEIDFESLRRSVILRQRHLLTYEDLCFMIISLPGKVPAEQALKGPYAQDKGVIILEYFAVSVLKPQKGIGQLTLSTVIDVLKSSRIFKRVYLECYLNLIDYYKRFGAYITAYTSNPSGVPYVCMAIDL